MTAVLLAAASAAAFGAMTVAIRAGLRDGGDPGGAAVATLLPALAIAFFASLVRHDYADAWRFFLAGLLAPGISQLLFTFAVREVGPSRTSVTVGAAPLGALAIAFVFLGEPVQAPLVVGGLAVVGGGVMLASERDRPGHLRARGLLFAGGAALFFGIRDNIVRALHAHGSPETVAVATLLAGTLVALAYSRRAPRPRSCAALPRLASSSGRRTSSCSRRTSTAGCRSSRRSSRPSRCGGSGSRCSRFARPSGWGARWFSALC